MKMNQELEKKLWASADELRGNVSSEEYMYIVIGIMFLKHMSDKYNAAILQMKADHGDKWIEYADDKDILSSHYKVPFLIPEKANWKYISQFATSPEIGLVLNGAFAEIEKENSDLLGLFDKRYNDESLDQTRLGKVVSQFSNIDLNKMGEDIIGRTYEYFLGEFFLKQGQKGGEFYTPKSIVDLMVQIINPLEGKLYDPTAGTGGMLVQARQHIIDQGKDPIGLVVYGQELQNKTWKLSRINLLLHGFSSNNIKMGSKSADTFLDDQHKGESFDYILANPPFNIKQWGYDELKGDERWKWGIPPKGNANLAFISHMLYKLGPNGSGASVLANGELSTSGKDAFNIRKKFVKDKKIEAIITLRDKLFYTTGIPASIWVFGNNLKTNNILMIDASRLEGEMLSKKVYKMSDEDIKKIVDIFVSYRAGNKIDEVGFAKVVSVDELEKNDYSFVPGRYVGTVEQIIDKEESKRAIKEAGIELQKLLKEFEDLVPKVNESIKKALNFKDEE